MSFIFIYGGNTSYMGAQSLAGVSKAVKRLSRVGKL